MLGGEDPLPYHAWHRRITMQHFLLDCTVYLGAGSRHFNVNLFRDFFTKVPSACIFACLKDINPLIESSTDPAMQQTLCLDFIMALFCHLLPLEINSTCTQYLWRWCQLSLHNKIAHSSILIRPLLTTRITRGWSRCVPTALLVLLWQVYVMCLTMTTQRHKPFSSLVSVY